MQPADRAWLTLGAGVLAWDLLGPETLSAAMGRYHQRWPWITRAVILYFAAHLLGVIPARADPLHGVEFVRRRLRRGRSLWFMSIGDLVQLTDGRWMIRPPTHCPAGHPLTGRVLVGHQPCDCGGHTAWRCTTCSAVTYGPPVATGCDVLAGPATVRTI